MKEKHRTFDNTPLNAILPDDYVKAYPHPARNPQEEVTFSVGTVVVTPAAMEALEFDGGGNFLVFLLRHAARLQTGSRKEAERPLAAAHRYHLVSGETLLVMLEKDEQVTTIMLLRNVSR
jgi:hypothetical protein